MASKPTLEQMSDLQLTATLASIDREMTELQLRLTSLGLARVVPLIKVSERDQMDTQMRNTNSELAVLDGRASKADPRHSGITT